MPNDSKKPSDGKPTISPDNHDQNVGQRQKNDQNKSGKQTISQKNHGNAGERSDEFDANAGQRLTGDKRSGTSENDPRVGPDDVEKTAGQRPTRDDGDNDDLGDLGGPGKGPYH